MPHILLPHIESVIKSSCALLTHTRTRGAKGGFKFVIEQQGAGRVLDFLLGTSTSITCSPLPFPFACFKLHRSPAGPPFSPPLCVNQCQMGWAGGRQSTLLTQSLTAANDNAQPAARTPFTPNPP